MAQRGETFVMSGDPAQQRIEFTTFVLGLASTALIHLGAAPHPDTQKIEADVTLARETLELLVLLREKTRGNLTADEDKVFGDVLADLQLRFVEAVKR